MWLQLENDQVIAWSKLGGIDGTDVIDFDESKLPDDFEENFKPSFYLLKNDEIVENPDFVEPEPPALGPSEQDKVNAQVLLKMAQQQQKQDAFNAQVLLQIAKLGGTANV
ncbi:DUF2977 domain-containing protein [Pediococcus stilesii]|uniref:Uncharacterized protein n=1 Tax=Pediococcus stilesii TaxID=331679 RepID=A0A0R2L7R1_9LACO|nr:DUF2977 domain-containing protein [Pediococcus stilesii]KRN94596.1 hypothetical protein IV81_GL001233 [Pediococcus stilesii]